MITPAARRELPPQDVTLRSEPVRPPGTYRAPAAARVSVTTLRSLRHLADLDLAKVDREALSAEPAPEFDHLIQVAEGAACL